MATPLFNNQGSSPVITLLAHVDEDDNNNATIKKYSDLICVLPRERGWLSEHIHYYQGFWYSTTVLKGLLILQHHFHSLPSDILLASYPKSGTTWLKALLFTVLNRTLIFAYADDNFSNNPLLKANPHELVPYLEAYACMNPKNPRPTSSSSLMNTHIPYSSLPNTVMKSGCRIVYVLRDPKDVLVSCWHFMNKLRPKELPPISLKEAFEQFSGGSSPYGPYWDHVKGYWKASLEFPDKLMLIRYEDLEKEPYFHVRRLARFLGRGFSLEEEKDGIVKKVVDFCSFENLSGLEVNKTGMHLSAGLSNPIRNNLFFRQGKVGNGMSHLSKEMVSLLDEITQQSFKDFNSESESDDETNMNSWS